MGRQPIRAQTFTVCASYSPLISALPASPASPALQFRSAVMLRRATPSAASTRGSASSDRHKSFDRENYQLIPARDWDKFFVVGRIFQVLLPEQRRNRTTLAPPPPSTHMFRRFVIVKTDTKISQCLQIKTYENKATTRPDVRNKQHEHAIIYTGVEPPKPLKGESNLQDPIEADAESQATYLSPFARINYGESHEIQHTEKVYNLGQVTENCVSKLQRTYDLVSCRSSTPEQTAPTRKRTFDDVTEGLERTSLDNDKRPFIYNDGRASEAASFYNTPSSLGDSSGNEGSPGHHDKVRKDAVFFGPLNDGHIFGTLLDTGAECNFISKRKADKLGARVLRYQGPDIKVGNGNILRPEGILSSCWRFNDKSRTYMDQFVIMPDLPADVVIGRQAIFDRSFLLANEELLILGLKAITKPERVAQEEAAIRKAEQNLKQEVQERDAMRSNLKKEREERQAKHR